MIALFVSFDNDGALSLASWNHVLHQARYLDALGNSLGFALATQSLSMVLGIAVSWLIARTDLPGRRQLEFAFWISFFLPSLAIVQGWTLMFDPHYGLLNRLGGTVFGLDHPLFDVYSWKGIVFAHLATTTVSAKVMMLVPAFRAMDARLEEAALMGGSSWLGATLRVTLPVIKPALVMTLLLGFVYALQSFEIELVLGSPHNIHVYSTVIYDLTRSDPVDFTTAFALGDVVAIASLAFAWLAHRSGSRNAYATVSAQSSAGVLRLRGWRWAAGAGVAALAALLTVIPLAFLVVSSLMTRFGFFSIEPVWTLSHWKTVLGEPEFIAAARNTLTFALGSAAVAVAASFLLAYWIVRSSGRVAALLSMASWAPSSMPAVLFSLAWLWLILRWAPDWVYGSTLSLIVVNSLAWLTLGTQMLRNQMGHLGSQLSEAAWLSGASEWTSVRTIVFPLCVPSMLAVAIMVFVSAIRDVGHIALLASGSNQPLSIFQLGYMIDGSSEDAAVVGVVLAALAIVAAWFARAVGMRTASHS
ncbi:hypothetical protein A6456_29525 [Paraburkholderia tropica]|nr:hypothetical protein A6456_29525 [Paraburkholderia tropica]